MVNKVTFQFRNQHSFEGFYFEFGLDSWFIQRYSRQNISPGYFGDIKFSDGDTQEEIETVETDPTTRIISE